jgi:hypothetical protein
VNKKASDWPFLFDFNRGPIRNKHIFGIAKIQLGENERGILRKYDRQISNDIFLPIDSINGSARKSFV